MKIEDCQPGMGVVYRSHPTAIAEDGDVIEIRPPYVMVRYVGDRTAKATRPEDLEPTQPLIRCDHCKDQPPVGHACPRCGVRR